MSSSRKRRYAQRQQNQHDRERQCDLADSWLASVRRVVHLALVLPRYDAQKLLAHEAKGGE
jgi:hypothetical protein